MFEYKLVPGVWICMASGLDMMVYVVVDLGQCNSLGGGGVQVCYLVCG